VLDARNSIPSSKKNVTPAEMFTGQKPSVQHLKVFGCKVWVRVADKVRKTLEPKAKKGVLLRCLSYGKYRVMLESTRHVVVSRHCKVIEDTFPMRHWKDVVRVSKEDSTHEEYMDIDFDDEMEISPSSQLVDEDATIDERTNDDDDTDGEYHDTYEEGAVEAVNEASMDENVVHAELERTTPVRRSSQQ